MHLFMHGGHSGHDHRHSGSNDRFDGERK
jgi:hypothetical protein